MNVGHGLSPIGQGVRRLKTRHDYSNFINGCDALFSMHNGADYFGKGDLPHGHPDQGTRLDPPHH